MGSKAPQLPPEGRMMGDDDIDLGEHTPDKLSEFLQSILPALLDTKQTTPA